MTVDYELLSLLHQTRLISLGEHGLFCNVSMNFGVLAALGIMCFICFVPGINDVSTCVLDHWLSTDCVFGSSEEALASKRVANSFLSLTPNTHTF